MSLREDRQTDRQAGRNTDGWKDGGGLHQGLSILHMNAYNRANKALL